MFPGAKPSEWEPVKIRTKIVTKTKVAESLPTDQILVPLPSSPDSKPHLPAGDGDQLTESSGGPSEIERPVNEQPNGEEPKSEQPNSVQPDVKVTAGDAPKVEQLGAAPPPAEDVEMKEAPSTEADRNANPEDAEMSQPIPQQDQPAPTQDESSIALVEEESNETFEDDHWSTEGAVYPIVEGRIENWSCFFALLSHIYNMISPPFHMPVFFVAQPCWSARDHEMITQYVFENWKIPAFCLMDSALTACYAYGVPTAMVVDVGHGKCDISAVTEFQVNEVGRAAAISGCGGRAMTKRLEQTLEREGFDESMAEQLKKSPICEILPMGSPYPKAMPNGAAPAIVNPAAAASTGALDSGSGAKDVEGLRPGQVPRGPGVGTTVGEEGMNGDDDDNEGVLDVAAIVARDNAAELLAKREKDKAEKAAAKKGAAAEGPRPLRLRNSEREKATFTYVDYIPLEDQSTDEPPVSRKRKREVEVGIERFMAVTPGPGMCDGIIDVIAEAIHHAILSVPDLPQRSHLWDNMIVVGNGSRIKGTCNIQTKLIVCFLTPHRLYCCSSIDPQLPLRPLSVHSHHIHLGTSLELFHTCRHPWHKHSHSWAGKSPAPPPGRPRRQSSPCGGYQKHDATQSSPDRARYQHWHRHTRLFGPEPPCLVTSSPRFQPVAHEHQDGQGPGLFPRVEESRRGGHGRGGVLGGAGGREGGIHRGSGQ